MRSTRTSSRSRLSSPRSSSTIGAAPAAPRSACRTQSRTQRRLRQIEILRDPADTLPAAPHHGHRLGFELVREHSPPPSYPLGHPSPSDYRCVGVSTDPGQAQRFHARSIRRSQRNCFAHCSHAGQSSRCAARRARSRGSRRRSKRADKRRVAVTLLRLLPTSRTSGARGSGAARGARGTEARRGNSA